MNTPQKVDQFISDKRAELGAERDVTRLLPGTLPFVTISSQSGAGGRRLADILSGMLSNDNSGDDALKDWRIFDKSMCQHVLEEEHLADAMSELLHEDYHSQVDEFVMGIFGDPGMQNVAYVRLSRVLRTIASVGKVIILGHGGSLATRNLSGGLHVRLVAPLAIRTARMSPMLEVDERRAMQLIRKRDKKQRRLIKTHYGVDSADPEHYDLVCNTERMSPQTVAELVMSLLHKKVD